MLTHKQIDVWLAGSVPGLSLVFSRRTLHPMRRNSRRPQRGTVGINVLSLVMAPMEGGKKASSIVDGSYWR